MPVLPQLRPSPGTALSRRGPPTATSSSSHGNLQLEDKMKVEEEESSEAMKRNDEAKKDAARPSDEIEESKSQLETKRKKRIRFVEPPKEEIRHIPPKESSDEESASSSDEDQKVKKTVKVEESSEEESGSSSGEISLPVKKTKDSESSSEEEQSRSSREENRERSGKVVSIAVHQEVPESLKAPTVTKKPLERESEEESSSEKEPSSSEESDESEEPKQYIKLQESTSEERLNKNGRQQSPEAETETILKVSLQIKKPETTSKDDLSTTKTPVKKKPARERRRIFEKVPNQNAVYVPLHGSSDEGGSEGDSKETREETAELGALPGSETVESSDSGKHLEYVEPANEYSILVPLHGRQNDFNSQEAETREEANEELSPIEKTKTEKDEKQAQEEKPDLKDHGARELEKPFKKHKPRMFFKVPNEDAVIIPLHGSSDEEAENPLETTSTEEKVTQYDRSETSTEVRKEEEFIIEEDEPNKYSVIVPLHKSPFEIENTEKKETNSGQADEHDQEDQMKETRSSDKALDVMDSKDQSIKVKEQESKAKPKKEKHRIFMKVPNQDAVYVPLHGSSDEDEVDEIKSDRPSETITEKQQQEDQVSTSTSELNLERDHETVYIEAPNQYLLLVPLHGIPGEQESEKEVSSDYDAPKEANATNTEKSKSSDQGCSSIQIEERENVEQKPVIRKKRLFFKVPNQNAVIVPLHSSSDEENRDDIEDDDGLIRSSPTVTPKEREAKTVVKEKNVIYEGEPNEYGIIVPLHGLPNLEVSTEENGSSNLSQTSAEDRCQEEESKEVLSKEITKEEEESTNIEEAPIKKKLRVFLKVPNEDAVYVPLHGSSDEEEGSDTAQRDDTRERSESIIETPKIQTIQRIYSGAPNEYSIFVPLHGSPGEQESPKEDSEAQSEPRKDELLEQKETAANEVGESSQPSPPPDAQSSQPASSSTKPKKHKQKLFFKVPNQNAVIVPLHGSSDEEEIRTLDDDDDGLLQTAFIKPGSQITDLKEKGKESQESLSVKEETLEDVAPNEYGVIVPLHGLPKELEVLFDEEKTASLKAVPSTEHIRVEKEGDTTGEQQGNTETTDAEKVPQKKIKKKQRIFLKVPNENAVIIPLHGSSDEEETHQRKIEASSEEPTTTEAASSSNDVQESEINEPSSERVETVYEQAPNEYCVLVPLHGVPGEERFTTERPFEAASPDEDSTGRVPEQALRGEAQTIQEMQGGPSDLGKQIVKPKKRKSKLFYKVPNENAYVVPLHGSSDEEEKPNIDEEDGLAGATEALPPLQADLNVGNQSDSEAPNEYGIIVPLHEFPYVPKTYEEESSSVTPIAGTASNKEGSSVTSEALDKDTKDEKDATKKNVKKKERIFMKVPNENAVYIPLHGSSDEDEKNNGEEDNVAPDTGKVTESLSKVEAGVEKSPASVKEETESKNVKIKKHEYVGAPNEYAILVPLHGFPGDEKQDVSREELPKPSEEVTLLPKSREKAEVAITPIIGKDDTKKLEKKVQQTEGTCQIDKPQTLSEAQPSSILSKPPEATKKEEGPMRISAAKEEDVKKPEEAKELKPKKRKAKVTKKETAEEKGSVPIKSTLKTAEKPSEAPPITKVSASKVKMPFKMADVVLDVLAKKAQEDETKTAPIETLKEKPVGKPEICSDEKTASPLPEEKEEKTGDHEYEPIQAPRAASQPPDSRGYAVETRSYPVEVKTRASESRSHPVEAKSPPSETKIHPAETRGQPLEARSHPVEVKVKQEEEDRYEVVRPQEAPIVQEVAPSLQVEGGYELVEEPKKQEPKRYIRIPNEDAVIVPLHGSSDEDINPDRYENPSLMMSEEEIERLSQSMPYGHIHQETPPEEAKPHETIQERLRSQADRFTTKLKGISKPNITLQKPKIKLPDRPNIKMPDMPKIKLPDRNTFHLPDTSKFHMPERPKFHLPDRPKFHLPDRPKFLTERPKFKLPDRPKFGRQEKKPKGPKGKKPNPSSLRRPLRDVVTISSQSTPGSTQNIFETLKFRTYPRFFKKKKPAVQKMSSLETESSQPSTPPARPRSYSGNQQDTAWVHAYRDVKFADEESNLRVERMEEEYEKEENAVQFQESYDDGVRSMVEREFKQSKAESMTSVVSEKGSSGSSSVRRRAGVIEEIDSDEFFLREKGLSREDVDVSRYLSLEIRDAFRQPKNALASLDSELYDDEEADIKFEHVPRAPQRTKPRKSSSFEQEQEQEFHTFPKRPSRRKESDPEIVVKPPRRFRSNSKSGNRYRNRQSSMPSLSSDLDGTAPEAPRRKSRERSIKSLTREGHISYHGDNNVQNQMSAQHSVEIPPVAPLRKSRSRGTSLADDDRTSRGADSAILLDDDDGHHSHHAEEREELDEEMMLEDEVDVKEEYAQEEEGGYKEVEPVTVQELHVEERSIDHSGYAVVAKDRKKPPRPPPPPHQHFHFQSQLDTIRNTGKQIFFTYPRRAIKSLHKQPPARPVRNYSTLGPVRPPRRNRVFRQPLYMTGDAPPQQEALVDKERDLQSGDVVMRMKGRPLPPPPRPPRKTKDLDTFIEGEIEETIPTESIVATTEIELETVIEPEIKQDRFSYLKSKKDQFLSTISKYRSRDEEDEKVKDDIIQTDREQITTSQQTSFDFEEVPHQEVSVSIQTDPLPKDVIVIDQEIEETEEIIILPDSNHRQAVEHKEEKSISESSVKTRSPIELKERRVAESIQKKEEPERESPETNIFQHALQRVEAARGVLKEARERVIPGSTSSLDERRTTEEKESPSVRVSQREALPTSIRSDEVEKEGTPPPLPTRPIYTKPIPVSFPDKLHLSELDVDKLNVSEIQANKIKVSEIESTCIDVTELTSRGGNLSLNGIELPPDFISNIVAQVAASQAQSQQAQQQQRPGSSRESTPQRQMRRVLTPPPPIFVQATVEPISLAEPKVPETDVTQHIPQPRITKSKGRKSPTRVIDDSEDELASSLAKRREREQESKKKTEEKTELKPSDSLGPRLNQASSLQLMGRLFSIWQDQVVSGTGTLVEGVNSLFPEGEKRRDAQIAAVILLVLITGLILVGFGFDNSVHHHHWDYLPPR